MSDVNVSGQAYGFLSMTPIEPGEEQALQMYLKGLRAAGERPFAKSPRTHMARWVIVEDFNNDRSYKQRKAEHLAIPSLCFSSNFDGDLDSYLAELCEQLVPEAQEVWGRCVGAPATCRGSALKDYLKHNQIDCGFFYAAYGAANVGQVKASLDQRERLMAFATKHQGASAADLQRAFVEEFAS